MLSTEQLYGISKQVLDEKIYNAIKKVMDQNLVKCHIRAYLISDAIASTRIAILKQRRFDLVQKGFTKMTKQESFRIDEITRAISFWRKLNEY